MLWWGIGRGLFKREESLYITWKGEDCVKKKKKVLKWTQLSDLLALDFFIK